MRHTFSEDFEEEAHLCKSEDEVGIHDPRANDETKKEDENDKVDSVDHPGRRQDDENARGLEEK